MNTMGMDKLKEQIKAYFDNVKIYIIIWISSILFNNQ